MASTGFKFCGTGESIDTGDLVWADPTNITADDNSTATTVEDAEDDVSDTLRGTNYDFSAIGDSDTINGIEYRYRRSADASKDVKTTTIQLVLGGVSLGTAKTSSGDWESSETATTVGGATDLWGATPSAADVKTSTFGGDLAVTWDSGVPSSNHAIVDSVEMNVHFTAAVSAAPTLPVMGVGR